VEHIEEVDDLFYGVRRPCLLSIPKRGIGNKDLFRGIDENKPVVEFHSGDLLIRENMPIKVGFLDVQEGKLAFGRLALKCFSLSGNSHLFLLTFL
jgi:hypothetical protein